MWVNHIDSNTYRPHHRVIYPPGGREDHERVRSPQTLRKPHRRNSGSLSRDLCPRVLQEEEKIKSPHRTLHFLRESDPTWVPSKAENEKNSKSPRIGDSGLQCSKNGDKSPVVKNAVTNKNRNATSDTLKGNSTLKGKSNVPFNMLAEEHLSGFIPSSVLESCLTSAHQYKDQVPRTSNLKNSKRDSFETYSKPLISTNPVTPAVVHVKSKVERTSENLFRQASACLYKVSGKQEVVNPITGAVRVFDVYRAVKEKV